jgi:hypothetical protein
MKAFALIAAAVIVVGLSAYIWRRSHTPLSDAQLAVQEIQRTDSAAEGAGQDVVVFNDGTRLADAGYDLEHVGTVVLTGSKPVFLFKSFSCRECEPAISLVVYSAEDKTAEKFPYPGSHVLIGSEGEVTEVEDQEVEGVYGRCGNPEPVVLLARKHREVESDGSSLRIGQDWNFVNTAIDFNGGKANVVNGTEDHFARLQELVGDDCLAIPTEDSHDYL